MSTRVQSRRGTHGSMSESMDHLQQKNNSRDEIVMTPLKAKVGQILRIERVPAGVLDNRKVHYAAEGPYKGIVVNRATNVRPYKTEPETVRRFIAYIQEERGAVKEMREIRFWYKPEMDSGAMEDSSTEFFKELISPKNFPKDHLQFVKRVLTLVQKYAVLRFIELEMRPYSSGDDPGDVRPKLHHAKSAVDPPRPVRQATSTDDLHHGGGHRPSRRRIRRLTISEIEPLRRTAESIPTVFVYGNNDNEDAERRKKKGRQQQQQQLQRSGGLENLNDIRTEDDSVFSYNGRSEEIPNSVHPEEIKRSAGHSITGAHGAPSNGNNIIPIYGVAKKNRRSTDTSATGSAVFETVALTRSPKGASRSGRGDSTAGDRGSRTPSSAAAAEKRRSSGRAKSSASLTSPGVLVSSTPIRDSYTGSDVFDGAPQKEGLVNGGSGDGRATWESSRIVAVLEDAFPTMLSVDELGRLSRMEHGEVEAELAKLSSAGMAMEVDSGHWVRSQLLKRLNPSSLSHDNNHFGTDADIHRNEFRMVASAPSFAPEDQPTIAIMTSLYCEKLAVDAMMDVKKTYVKYKTKGEGVVYTVGVIGRHRIVSTKLSKVGRGSETKLSAENTVPRLLATFDQIEHVLLVGVGGGVANYDDDSDHVRLGDVVVSKATDLTDQFTYFHVTGSGDKDQSPSITLETRPWSSSDRELEKVVAKMERSPKKVWKQMDTFLAEVINDLDLTGQMTFTRPPPDSDQLYRTSAKTRTPVPHPAVAPGSPRDQRPRQPLVHFGAAASGKILVRNDAVRTQFCLQQHVKVVDSGVQKVLDSLADEEEVGGRRRPPLGFILVRGVADYSDGTRIKEWQRYASLAAAAVMKCVVMRLSSPADAHEVV